jgi:hypothetical protein
VTLGCVVALVVLPSKMFSAHVLLALVVDALATLGTHVWQLFDLPLPL